MSPLSATDASPAILRAVRRCAPGTLRAECLEGEYGIATWPAVIEGYPAQNACFDVITVRAGPDRLPLLLLSTAPTRVVAAVYWYRDHTWCRRADCRCRFYPRTGDGWCVAALEDGARGFFRIYHEPINGKPDWAKMMHGRLRVSRIEHERLRTGTAPGVPNDADGSGAFASLPALWAAVALAEERGILPLLRRSHRPAKRSRGS